MLPKGQCATVQEYGSKYTCTFLKMKVTIQGGGLNDLILLKHFKSCRHKAHLGSRFGHSQKGFGTSGKHQMIQWLKLG